MNELLPIIRRKRRPLVMSQPQKPGAEELNRTETTDGTQELEEARADTRPTTNEKESDADVSTEDEAH